MANNAFITCPETTLPCGLVVPAFKVAKYLASKGDDGRLAISATGKPWVRIDYDEARRACADAGYQLIAETQWLALAWDIYNQPANWSKGVVGKGKLFRGLHKGTVSSAQPADYVSPKKSERRSLVLSNGEEIFDLAGNAWEWVFDDVQGDADGIVATHFAKDSPSLSTAPHPSMKKGMGWRPDAGQPGAAPIRGGSWYYGASAGLFALILNSARSYTGSNIGFRPAFVA